MLLRLKIFTLLIICGFFLLLIRLFYWQVYKGSELAIEARGQQQVGRVLSTTRGDILASDRSFWAASTDAWLVWANPTELKASRGEIADALSVLFVEDSTEKDEVLKEANRLKELLNRNDQVWVALKQKVSRETK